MTGAIIAGIVCAILISLTVILHERENQKRAEQGLPPKKHHDITDNDGVLDGFISDGDIF